MNFKNNISRIDSKLFDILSECDDFNEDFVMNDEELKKIYLEHVKQFSEAQEELNFYNKYDYSSSYTWLELCEHVRTINKREKEDINNCLKCYPEKVKPLIDVYPRQMYMLFGDKFFTDKSVYYKYEYSDDIMEIIKYKNVKHKQDVLDYIKLHPECVKEFNTYYSKQLYQFFGTEFITTINDETFDDYIYSSDIICDKNKKKITDFSNVCIFTNITSICLSHKTIDLNAFKNFKLTTLKLNNCEINNFQILPSFTTLKELTLNNCGGIKLTLVASLVNLTYLNVSYNKIKDISQLSSMVNLTHLCLSRNLITDITPISSLVNLKALDVYDNKIVNVSCLTQLKDLNLLNLACNEYMDIETVKKLSCFKHCTFMINANFIEQFEKLLIGVSRIY